MVGQALAARFGVPFIEGDALHGPANVEKMRKGVALTDDDRWPWLSRVGADLGEAAKAHGGAIAACSSLKKSYRDRLRAAVGGRLRFVFLDGDAGLLGERMGRRTDHFMPSSLLESQLATLEPPVSEPDVVHVVIDGTPEAVVARAVSGLAAP